MITEKDIGINVRRTNDYSCEVTASIVLKSQVMVNDYSLSEDALRHIVKMVKDEILHKIYGDIQKKRYELEREVMVRMDPRYTIPSEYNSIHRQFEELV